MELDTLEKDLGSSAKILLDADSGNNLLYLPLGELREGAALTPPPLNLTPELQQKSSSESQTDTRNRGRSGREGRGHESALSDCCSCGHYYCRQFTVYRQGNRIRHQVSAG